MTFRELDGLIERYREKHFREVLLPAGHAWLVQAESNRDRKAHPASFTLADYPLLKEYAHLLTFEKPVATGAEYFAQMVALTRALGGTIEVDRPIQ